ncbi:hypothetical protein BDN72DRAFT_965647 [Pluteus cervinus]|uniref:Uncharacterized protein n=1 Tax=Pluteus cervinus TaxID=181527 RepID=A0ACD3A573_9AGAR|nr:hypothetical protein BDN72DRAFT_965647 [Pluteus cervinus]
MSHLMDIHYPDTSNDIPNTPNTLEIQEIDKEIAELSEKLLLLKSKRNSLVPIARLQPEILLVIFFSLQSLCFSDPETYHEWIVITHVSQRWRNLALGTGTLWGGIVHSQASSERLAMLSLERSRSSDLDISFSGACATVPNHTLFLNHITDNISRIRSLYVELQYPDNSDSGSMSCKIKKGLAQSLPALKELTLCGSYYHGVDYTSPIGPIIAPNLRSICLVYAQIKLPWAAYSKITHLHITNGEYAVTLSSLLCILTHTTKLRTLELRLGHLTRDTEHVDGPIYLSHLSSIHLDVSREDFIHIISNIKIPPITTVAIPDAVLPPRRRYKISDFQFDDFFAVLGKCFLDGERKIHRFYYTERDPLCLQFWDVGSEVFSVPSSFCVQLHEGTDWIPGFMSSTWFSFSRLYTVQLRGTDRGSKAYLHPHRHHALLSALSSSPLSELALADSFSLEVVDYIANHPMSFPTLETLSLYERELDIHTLLRLCDALENREKNGIPRRLKTLALGSDEVKDPAIMATVLGRLENLGLSVIQETVSDIEKWFYKC